MLDVIIRNGRVIDGSGNPWFKADVGVEGGKVRKIGNLQDARATLEVDAEGRYISPGFIDIHQHSDITILAGPSADSALKQGITTVIVGNCGHSGTPVRDRELLKSNIYGFQPEWGIDLEWSSVGEYLDRLRRSQIAINIGTLVGHGAIRLAVMGFENRACTPEELSKMKDLLEESLKEGAMGFSTGLEYSPGKNADLHELIELNKVVASQGKFYATHIRNRDFKFKEALEEAIATAKEANVRLQISHITPRFWTPGEPIKMITELLDGSETEGLEVACDIYPYTFAAFTLGLFIPPWAYQGGVAGVLNHLKWPQSREKIKQYKDQPLAYLSNTGQWDKLILCTTRNNPDLVGKSFDEIGKIRQVDPHDALLDVLLEEEANFYNVLAYCITIREEDIEEMIRYPKTIMMSDSYTLSQRGVLKNTVMGPAAYSWTVRYLTHYIRERKVLSLEEAIKKITSFSAQSVGLFDRGLIRPGMWADLVVFDYQNLKDNSALSDPNQYPSGIEHVFVNGGHVIRNGEQTNGNFGAVL